MKAILSRSRVGLLATACAVVSVAGAPALASAQPQASTAQSGAQASTAQAGAQAVTGEWARFLGDGVRIWSEPGRGVVRGYGYKGQGFCIDYHSGSYSHGRNEATGVVGFVHQSLIGDGSHIEC